MRVRYQFVVAGYVVMPEHFQVLRARCQTAQGTSDGILEEGHVWQRRFYDFMVWSEAKRVEKLRYMHRNPVVRGLALAPEQWAWSSFRHYAYDEPSPVLVNEARRAELKSRASLGEEKRRDRRTG